jgi:hypothetical protein
VNLVPARRARCPEPAGRRPLLLPAALLAALTAQAGPPGVTFTGAQVRTWEPVGERGIHFTGVRLQTDAS